jgi:2-keto-4-pentenoate hydratase/2-oxohepta-3-ene-1,7-dioic acid hydratase in catechol pathway
MKLATYRIETAVGPFERFGVVHHAGDRAFVIDANFAFAAACARQGHPSPNAKADAMMPAALLAYAALHGTSHALLADTVQAAVERGGGDLAALRGPRGERVAFTLDEVRLRPPVPRVPVLRDFAAFEDHLRNTFARMGLTIPDVFYERPTAFKANGTALYGHDDDVPWPRYGDKLDYELEVAAVIGVPARNVDAADAHRHVLGYTMLNDFSVRDIQKGEMNMSTGPFKGKDFAWGLGPWIVTPDEAGDPAGLRMSVRVNGEVWAESTPGEMQWTFPEIIAYTSQDETLNVGDVLGSGTVNRGCGFEIDRWIAPGDTVEIVGDRIGVLRNRVVRDAAARPVRWRRTAGA